MTAEITGSSLLEGLFGEGGGKVLVILAISSLAGIPWLLKAPPGLLPRCLFALEDALRFSDAHWAVPSLEERAVHAHVEGGTKKNPTPHQGHLRSFPQALKKP